MSGQRRLRGEVRVQRRVPCPIVAPRSLNLPSLTTFTFCNLLCAQESAASGGAWRYRVGGRVADRRGRGMVGSGSFFGRIVRVCDVGRDFGAKLSFFSLLSLVVCV